MSAIQLVLIQLVTFGIFIWILKIIFYSDLSKAKTRLSTLNDRNIEKEKELNLRIKEAEEESKRILVEAEEEAKKNRNEAKNDAEKITTAAKEVLEEERKSIQKRANDQLEKLKADIRSDMEKKSIGIACEMVKNVLTSTVRSEIHNQMIDELMGDVNAIESNRINILSDKGKIISPFPVTADQKKRLEDILTSKSNKTVSFEEEIDEELIMGMKIDLPGLIIDGTLKNKLDKMKNS